MEYTTNTFINFLEALINFDKDCRSVIDAASRTVGDREKKELREWEQAKADSSANVKEYNSRVQELLSDFQKRLNDVLLDNTNAKAGQFLRLQNCKDALALISCAEKSIIGGYFEKTVPGNCPGVQVTIDQILAGKIDYLALAYEINSLIKQSQIKTANAKYSEFLCLCQVSCTLLDRELVSLRSQIAENVSILQNRCIEERERTFRNVQLSWNGRSNQLKKQISSFAAQKLKSKADTDLIVEQCQRKESDELDHLRNRFQQQFPPLDFADEYLRIYSLEPMYADYECLKEMPQNVRIATLEYSLEALKLCDITKWFLEENYPFMCRGDKLCIPYCVPFNKEFNALFRFTGDERQSVVNNACNFGMRMFTMLPPGKLNFTFVDPVTLGETFATFTRLVDADDRTSEVINGKIWSSPTDIEEKLKILTDHISNVTQRCLQGKYENIYEYNRVADQNAEAYQILMLMDFPAGMTDQSLKLLEQIVTSGPKCGVFTVIYQNESQYKKVPERSQPMIGNIESNLQEFEFSPAGTSIYFKTKMVSGKPLIWNSIELPASAEMDQIIATLKKGIKTAEKVVIDIEKVNTTESVTSENANSTKDGIHIPIGIRGANDIQYLTLGVGGSHHALIAGVAGSGKSSLLHTIILQALTQYQASPDELEIYLVDFKRGVEFKIYADFEIPAFKVIAIESEREFGYNILTSLEREQKIRADLFKKSRVDKIEEYRNLGKRMPRILVIMDEFHELFSNANDEIGRKSAQIMERIVRQGRAFGVHMILASQSYSNISGIDRAVFDQMAVRIVLKCSKADANLLLDGGSNEIDLISIDDPGRAVYNSEAGNREYNSHFRVAYIAPEKHRGMLQEISNKTRDYVDPKKPTRILLSNIEDNKYSIFNQFTHVNSASYQTDGRIYIGEPLSIVNQMPIDFARRQYSNLLMIGNDTDMARNMFSFTILSLCINYYIKHKKAPSKPIIYVLNCKPLDDSYFTDIPHLMATELLTNYVQNVPCWDNDAIAEVLAKLHENVTNLMADDAEDKFILVFGYQRAECLKTESKNASNNDIFSSYDMMPHSRSITSLSNKELFDAILTGGAEKGVHTILWQDSYQALNIEDNKIGSYFTMKIAFDMSAEDYSRFVGANDTSLMSDNNAIYYNRARDNQKFRPYQTPDEEWLREICEKLQ